jgi:hypothetical protein
MASIKLKDLAVNSMVEADLFNNSDSFIRDLSKCELNLQGGKRRPPAPTVTPPNDTPFVVPDISSLDLSNILQGFAPYSIF